MLEELSVFTPTYDLSIYPAGFFYEFLVHYLFVLAELFKSDKSRNQWLNTGKASLIDALAFEGGLFLHAGISQGSDLNS